jgi:hypothetical protein
MQVEQGEAGFDYLMNGGLGRLVSDARNAILARLEVELAPLQLTSAQFVAVVGIIRGCARTFNEFAPLPASMPAHVAPARPPGSQGHRAPRAR